MKEGEKLAKTVNKTELIKDVTEYAGFAKHSEGERALQAALDAIAGALEEGKSVAIQGFGTFALMEKPETTGRNPQTGESITIAAHTVVKFKPSEKLKATVKNVKVAE
jgi:DNA-binding protein HU-beta